MNLFLEWPYIFFHFCCVVIVIKTILRLSFIVWIEHNYSNRRWLSLFLFSWTLSLIRHWKERFWMYTFLLKFGSYIRTHMYMYISIIRRLEVEKRYKYKCFIRLIHVFVSLYVSVHAYILSQILHYMLVFCPLHVTLGRVVNLSL